MNFVIEFFNGRECFGGIRNAVFIVEDELARERHDQKITNARQFALSVPQHAKGLITIELYDPNGMLIGEVYRNNHNVGKQEIPLSFKGIEKGLYRAVIRVNGEMIHQLPMEVVQ